MKKGWGLQNSRSRMIALFIVDMLTVVLDSYLAIILRFKLDNIWVPEEYMSSVEHYMIINVITTVIIFLLLNLYNRVWSYASLYEMLLIVCAAMLSTAFQAFGRACGPHPGPCFFPARPQPQQRGKIPALIIPQENLNEN